MPRPVVERLLVRRDPGGAREGSKCDGYPLLPLTYTATPIKRINKGVASILLNTALLRLPLLYKSLQNDRSI